MRLKLFFYIMCLISLVLNANTQSIEHFVGEYEVNHVCFIPDNFDDLIAHFENVNYDNQLFLDTLISTVKIDVSEIDTIDLKIEVYLEYSVNANILTDSTFFIYPQTLFDPILGYFGAFGEGLVTNDSLLIYHKFESVESISCKTVGFKKTEDTQKGYPIPAPESEWGYVTFRGPPGLEGAGSFGSVYKYDGKDTIINNNTYQHWFGNFTRYENNKLYKINKNQTTADSIVEQIYYDFNLAVNDTFFLPYTGDDYYAIVDEVNEFTTLNGQIRKEILLKTEDFTCTPNLRWIEGIGDITNGLFYKNQLGLCDIYTGIFCFSDSSGHVFKQPNFNYPCDSIDTYTDIINNVDDISYHTEITISPNPAQHQLNFVFSNGLKSLPDSYVIYNLNGTEILKTQLNSKIKNVDIRHLKSGTYLIHFLKDEVSIASGRFVKME